METDIREWIKVIEEKHNYMVRMNYEDVVYNEEIINYFRILFKNSIIDRNIWREFKDVFEELGDRYNDKTYEWNHYYFYRNLNDRELAMFKKSLNELKKANINFKIKVYKPY